jgi:hypothetical protein
MTRSQWRIRSLDHIIFWQIFTSNYFFDVIFLARGHGDCSHGHDVTGETLGNLPRTRTLTKRLLLCASMFQPRD